MDVRKMVKTTLSVTVLITGFVFFRLYFIRLLSGLLNSIYENIEYEYYEIIALKLNPAQYTGNFFPVVFYICVILILTARTIDVIINYKFALGVLSSFIQPLFLTALAAIALSVSALNILQLWAIFYILIIICLHTSINKMLLQTESTGTSADLKLFKGFALTIKKITENAVSLGFKRFKKPADEAATLGISGLMLVFEAIVFVSFIVYMATHLRLIFLSHLIIN